MWHPIKAIIHLDHPAHSTHSAHKFIISDEQSKRLYILKLLMAFFVVYIHCVPIGGGIAPRWFELLKYTVSGLISQCAVSCFFLMASILLYRKDVKWKDNIAKKCRSLLIPYFIMNTVWIVIFAVCQSIPQTAVFFKDINNRISEFSIYRWFQSYGIGATYPFLGPLYFLRNLFILNLLAHIIKFLIDRFPKSSLFFIIALYFLLPLTNTYFRQIADSMMWCFGYLIVKYRVNINKFDDNKWIPITYIVTIFICLILRDVNIIILSTALQRFFYMISIIFWYSCFTKNLNGTLQRLFLRYSVYNFGIYIFHENTLTIAIRIIAAVLGTSIYVQIFELVFLPLIIAAFIIVLCIVFKKAAPKVFSIMIGARVL